MHNTHTDQLMINVEQALLQKIADIKKKGKPTNRFEVERKILNKWRNDEEQKRIEREIKTKVRSTCVRGNIFE